jgi:hypothetical protein
MLTVTNVLVEHILENGGSLFLRNVSNNLKDYGVTVQKNMIYNLSFGESNVETFY